MTEEQVRSLFTLAGIPFLRIWELPNGYWSPASQVAELRDSLANIVRGLERASRT